MTTESLSQSDLLPPLLGIGFSKTEALVYLAALELGPSPIWDISKKSGVKRPTCYVILDELMLKGYASTTTDGKRSIYSVTSPRLLLQAAERRYERFAGTVTQLDALASKGGGKPVVSFYEGPQGVRDIYLSSLDQPVGGEILFLGSDAITAANYPGLLTEYMVLRQKKQIAIRVIFEDIPKNREIGPDDSAQLRQTRYLPTAQFRPLIEQHIFGDKVVYISHDANQPFATTIENAAFAEQERQKFELLWGVATS